MGLSVCLRVYLPVCLISMDFFMHMLLYALWPPDGAKSTINLEL